MLASLRFLLIGTLPLSWIGAAIAAGAALVNQQQQSSASGSATKQARQFTLDYDKYQYSRPSNYLQKTVTDAKAAGLHPLFALGAGGQGDRSFSVGGGGGSGSYVGDGLARAGKAIGDRIDSSSARDAAKQLHELTMARGQSALAMDNIELMKAQMELKMMEQQAMGGPRYTSEGVAVYPEGVKQGLPLEARPLVTMPRKSVPLRDTAIGDDGWRYRTLNPDAGLDELGIVDFTLQWLKQKGWRAWRSLQNPATRKTYRIPPNAWEEIKRRRKEQGLAPLPEERK